MQLSEKLEAFCSTNNKGFVVRLPGTKCFFCLPPSFHVSSEWICELFHALNATSKQGMQMSRINHLSLQSKLSLELSHRFRVYCTLMFF